MMILIVSHLAFFNIFCHAVKLFRKIEFALFAGDRVLIVQINLDILVFHHKTENLIGRFFVLAVFHNCKQKVNAGIQNLTVRFVVCRENEGVNVHVRIYGKNLRHCITSDTVHRGFASRKGGTCIVVAVCCGIRLRVGKKLEQLF